jgi:alpha-glucuronidase
LDGQFAENAIVQIKNGPIDFQVREPVHPLFGALPNTNSMMELQITQEYTGQTTHLCYLVPQWKEVYDFDTHAEGAGTTVTKIVSGQTYDYRHCGVAGVMNFGDDTNWTRHHLAAANTHGYGRLAWNPDLDAEQIADEWVRMTFGSQRHVTKTLTPMLLSSWSTYESYNSPLGAGFMQGGGDHLNPCAECNEPWHQSDADGIGFDRTVATGTGTTGHYHSPVSDMFESPEHCPDELLLFFHHVPYSFRLDSGKTVIQHIYDSHFDGVEDVEQMRRRWRSLRAKVDPRRFAEILASFDSQVGHAELWRDRLVSYWFGKSRILDRHRSWVQAQFPRSRTTIFNGQDRTLTFTIGNASQRDKNLTYTLDAPDGWTSSEHRVEVPARGLAEVEVTTRPAGRPMAGVVRSDLSAGDTRALRDYAEVLTAPAGAECALALDAGTAESPLVDGYQRLSPDDLWDSAKGFGWVGDQPQSRDRQTTDELLRDFVNDIPARTLRIAVPAGLHQVYLLTGDASVASRPMFVSSGGELLAEMPLLFGGQFGWMDFELDGGPAGREVDLEFSGLPDEHWHLGALALIAAGSA